MKYMVTFPLTTMDYKERVARFLESGAPPPEGVAMHGRWFTLAHNKGFILAESNDPSAIFRWVSEWTDVIDFEVEPVLTDQEAAVVLTELSS